MAITSESPRPTMSQELMDHIQTHYGVRLETAPKDLGGSRNLNLLLTTKDKKLVARVYRAGITQPRLMAIQKARSTLHAAGVPSPVIEHTVLEEPWTSFSGSLIEVEAYVEHEANMNSWGRLAIGLPWLGRTHSVLKTLPVDSDGNQPMIANHIGSDEVLAVTSYGVAHIRHWASTTEQSRFADAAEALAQRLQEAEESFIGQLPTQLVHGDFWDNNVFFKDEKVVLITDLDFMGVRPRIDDLALTLYYTNSTFADDQLSGTRRQSLKTLADAYNSGLQEPLAPTELQALPLAIARTPLFMLRYIGLMKFSETAARPISETLPDLEWALKLLDDLDDWQKVFAA